VTQISVALLRPLAELLDRLETGGATLLAAFGIDADTAPNTYVSGDAVDRHLEAVAAQRGDAAFGLTLAQTAMAQPIGVFGHMVWLSGSVRDALARAIKFYGVITRRTTLSFEDSGGRAWIRQHAVPGANRGPILTELAFASLALRARAATGGAFAVRAVQFHHAGTCTAQHRTVFRAPVVFGADVDELELDPAQLDLRLATSDPITSAALEAKIAQLTDEAAHDPFTDRVRRAVASKLGSAITLAMIAREVGTTGRTLTRHLDARGTSLRGVVDDVRSERAAVLLAKGTPLKEIAFALGFSEPSAFSRAYKRWTGRAPNHRVK
jgi:AraC-like DNA-binding protein